MAGFETTSLLCLFNSCEPELFCRFVSDGQILLQQNFQTLFPIQSLFRSLIHLRYIGATAELIMKNNKFLAQIWATKVALEDSTIGNQKEHLKKRGYNLAAKKIKKFKRKLEKITNFKLRT